MTWTQERINTLIKLWLSGKSASVIATELGDISRNAVIGKVHRLGIAGREHTQQITISKEKNPSLPKKNKKIHINKDIIIETKKKPVLSSKPQRKKHITVQHIPNSSKYIIRSILNLNDKTCKWPIGHPDEDDFHFCGCPTTNSPYCSYHASLAYTVQTTNKNDKNIKVSLNKANKIPELVYETVLLK